MAAALTHSRRKALGIWLVVLALAVIAWHLPRIPQPPEYHRFADQSAWFGVPHFFDTSSNLLFVLAGLAGLGFLRGTAARGTFRDRREALPYTLFFIATILVGFGSGYYHLVPDNSRLVWDRAAVSLAFMSWFAAILCERIGTTVGLRLLPLLITAGVASVGYWGWSETVGQGDLRPYVLVLLLPIVLIPLLLWLYPPRYSGDRDILAVILLYLLALACDYLDGPIAALTGFVSGHTVKHVLAAGAAYWVVIRLKRRHPA